MKRDRFGEHRTSNAERRTSKEIPSWTRMICSRLCFGAISALFLFYFQSASATDAVNPTLQIPKPGDAALHILSPNVLELMRVNTKSSGGAVDSWDWVDGSGNFAPPNMSSIRVVINGQTNTATVTGFKRRPLYAPQATWDLRIANSLYLQVSSPIADGQSIEVINDG